MKDVALSLAIPVLKDGELRLPYTVVNKSTDPVFLLNLFEDIHVLLKPPPRSKWSAELAPTCYLANEGTLVTWAGALPRNARPGVSYFAPYYPLASRILPGETFRAVLRFPLPILEWNPYNTPSSDEKIVEPTKAAKFRLILDVVREKDARLKDLVKAQPGAYQVTGHPIEKLTAEAELSTPVIVLLRKDADLRRILPRGPAPVPPNAPPGWKPAP